MESKPHVLDDNVSYRKPWTKRWGKYFLPWRFSIGNRARLRDFENNGCLQIFTFTWLLSFIKRALSNEIDADDFGEICQELDVEHTVKKLKHYLKKNMQDLEKKSLLPIFLKFCGSKLIFYVFLFITGQLAFFTACGIISRILFEYLDSPEDNWKYGMKLVAMLVFLLLWTSLARQLGLFLASRIGSYTKSAFLGLVYEKSLKMKTTGSKSIGEFVNLCSNDATRIYECFLFLVTLFVSPLQILINTIYLAFYFGPSSLVGSAILILYLPVTVLFGRLYAKLRRHVISNSDERVKMITEAITYVKLIKMYAWEKPFVKKIHELRRKERVSIQKMAYVQSISFASSFILTFIAPIVTILVAVYHGENINLPKVFTMLTIFGMTSSLLSTGQKGLRRFAEFLVSLRRLKMFLLMEEKERGFKECPNENFAIEIENASFGYKEKLQDKEDKQKADDEEHESEKENLMKVNDKDIIPILYNINMNIQKKTLIGVCGPVGCGKSSLLQALLNEMEMAKGECRILQSIAYVPQQAWIMHDTLKENILFGNTFDKQLYDNVLEVCSLNSDINSMHSGDLTEIGERGINLSGGQKQRISLARALYADKDLYLLDDPLSAVDSHVGSHIFKNCIQTSMKNKTVVMVTHNLQYLKDCDYVVYMKDGRFEEQGTYKQLMEDNKEFAADMKKYIFEHKDGSEDKVEKKDDHYESSKKEEICKDDQNEVLNDKIENFKENEIDLIEKGRLISEERKESGAVSFKTFLTFFNYCGGFFAGLLVFGTNISGIILQISSDYWLSYWLRQRDSFNQKNITTNSTSIEHNMVDTDYYMVIYCILAVSMIICTISAALLTVLILLRGSTAIHNALFNIMFKSSMQFFDTTPSGRILNCLSKDVDEIDSYLPNLFIMTIRFMSFTFGLLIFVAINVPWFIIPLSLVILCLCFMTYLLRHVVRQVKRIENVTRSPVYSHIATTIQGITTIRTYFKEEHFTNIFRNHLNKNIQALFYFDSVQRWFGINVDFLCICCVLATSISVVLLKGEIAASIGALCISYSIQTLGKMQVSVRFFTEIEARFTSVERLITYIKTLTPEGDFETKEELAKDWPKDGSIIFDSISLRYRDNLPFVLKDLSFEIEDKEKIGIVGRTGAGKSSIGVALYRLVNPQNGTIKIAGVDTQNIGLHDLRKELTIIPQDPVLFIGTIRYNLDPFNEYDDKEIWDALEKAHIKEMVSNLPKKLFNEVIENGDNFSVGERQLICLARAALRKSKILILDEATASIDANSDSKIQETIKDAFADSTILTIAHRLNTIMHCDRIIVMEKGEVIECDAPNTLLSRDSKFKEIAKAAHLNT